MNRNQISPELLKRYLEGGCDPDEIYLVEQWYAAVDREKDNNPILDQQQHFKKIQDKIGLRINSKDRTFETNRKLWPALKRYGAAAIVVLMCGISLYLYKSDYGFNKKEHTRTLTTISNSQKQVQKHFLPDGTIVWLNPKAVLSYSPETFSAQTRKIYVTGEAFLDVTKDASRPFFVNTGNLMIKVLGTSFNVKAIPGQKQDEVSVVSGKVQVSTTDDVERKKYVMLLPRQKAVFQIGTKTLTAAEVVQATGKSETWQPVSLTFEDENLGEVIKRLQAKFGISIQLANKDLNNCLLTAAFENNRLSEILETTTQMLNATYEINENSIIIHGEGCAGDNNQ